MERNGSPKPEFDTDDDRSYFLIRLPVHWRALHPEMPSEATSEVGAHDEAHDGAHDGAHEPLSDSERSLLELCLDHPMSTHDLLKGLGYETRTGNFKRAVGRMLEVGALEMTIPGKPRSKNQKYRVTGKGRRWLEAHAR